MKRRALVLTASLAALIITSLLGILLGSAKISPIDSILALFGVDNGESSVIIIRSLRLPRVIGGIFAGAALAVSGLLLQSATGNDLTAPNIVGINSGAGLFVMLVLTLIPTFSGILPIAAFLGALLAAALVLGLARNAGGRDSRSSVVLAGIAVGAIFSAGISFLSILHPDALASYTAFSVGGLSGVYFEDISLPVLIITLFLILSAIISPRLNLLALGDDMAASMGVRASRLRSLTVLIAAVLASSAVSYIGLLGFVGLIIPHISRKLLGSDNRVLLPTSAILGGTLVTLADLLSRVLFSPTELPCGILISAVGAPFFLYLLISVRRARYD